MLLVFFFFFYSLSIFSIYLLIYVLFISKKNYMLHLYIRTEKDLYVYSTHIQHKEKWLDYDITDVDY